MIIVKSITIIYAFFHDESICGPQLFVKLRSQQSKQSCDSFVLVCSTNKSLGLSRDICMYSNALIYLLVNNDIKSYKIKEIFGKVFRGDYPIIHEGRE